MFRPEHFVPYSQREAARLSLLIMAGVLGVASCSKEAPKAPVSSRKPDAAPTAKVDSEILNALDAPAAPVSEGDKELDRRVADFKREHPFANATELLKLPAFTEKLGEVLRELGKDKELQDRINKTVHAAGTVKDGAAPLGSYRLDLKVDNYSPERTDRMLASVLSGDPKKLVGFVLDEVDQAGAEFSLLPGTERASNGMAVQRVVPPPPPPQ